jgi:hypothetical protein
MVSSRHQEVVMEMNSEMTELSLDHLASVSGGGPGAPVGQPTPPPPPPRTNNGGSTTTDEDRKQSDALKGFQQMLQELP